MADVHSREIRSKNMAAIKGKNTKPEMPVRRTVRTLAFRGLNDANLKISPRPHGYRYKLHDKSLPAKPDIVLPKYKTGIFVHGCFWLDIKTTNTSLLTKQEKNAAINTHYHLLLLLLSFFLNGFFVYL